MINILHVSVKADLCKSQLKIINFKFKNMVHGYHFYHGLIFIFEHTKLWWVVKLVNKVVTQSGCAIFAEFPRITTKI